MGALDGIIQLLLFVCFSVYVVMGLSFLGMGIFYLNDEGAVGSTGLYLIVLGVAMLIVGGLAIFANLKKIWLILFVIELVNVALFLIIYVLIICVLMMATGTTDPVRRATDRTWPDTLKYYAAEGSDPADLGGESMYCKVYGGAACANWYDTVAISASDNCPIGEDGMKTVPQALAKCVDIAVGDDYSDCSSLEAACTACDLACKEAAIQDVKDQILPASIFVFILCGYLAIVVVWNNIMIASEAIDGVSKTLGLVFNGVLGLLALILVIMGTFASMNASDVCAYAGDDNECRPDTLIVIIIIGLGLMVVSAVVLAGVNLDNHMMLRVGTLVMVFLALACLLTGLILGISSGAVMDDMNFYYDSNYPRLRAALERADNSYCKLRREDCTNLANNNVAGVRPKICNDDYSQCDEIEDSAPMTPDAVWRNMWSVAAQYAADSSKLSAQSWLENCESSGICIFCDEFYEDIEVTPSDAPNLSWKEAVVPPSNGTAQERWDAAQTAYGSTGRNVLKCAETQAGKCAVEGSTFPYSQTVCSSETSEDACLQKYGCAYIDDTCVLQAPQEVSNAAETGWSDIIANYSALQDSSWRAKKTKCEMALIKHTKVTSTGTCKGAGDLVPTGDEGLYMADCDSCNDTPDFMFSSLIGSSYCLSYFVGHYEDVCDGAAGTSPSAKCMAEFRGSPASVAAGDDGYVSPGDAADHVEYMVNFAYEASGPESFRGSAADGKSSTFCGYTDDGCKAKIKTSVEGSMSVIGYIGVVFIVFFLAIIFLTLQGIKIYKSDGGDGDDDDGDDGGGDSDE